MGDYKKLQVWLEAKDLAVMIYKITKDGSFSKDFGLRDQVRRASVSVASNIAEGEESGRTRKAINYFYIARGSLAELETQLIIAYEVEYLKKEVFEEILSRLDILSRKLRKLIQYRESNS